MTSPIHGSGGQATRCVHRLVFGVVVGLYQPLADDEREPGHPTKPVFCSRFRRQRKTVPEFPAGFSLASRPLNKKGRRPAAEAASIPIALLT
jgi:hypothetical protein